MKGRLFVISGPSGSGKSTICRKIVDNNKNVVLSISATTRKPREQEKDGINYFFLTKEEFEQKIKENAFYEYALVFNNYYGTLKEKIDDKLKAGLDVILEIDVQGAMQMKEQNDDIVMIFIMPPSKEELLNRLTGRKTENSAEIELRTAIAIEEMEKKDEYDHIVVNDDLEKAIKEVEEIINK